MSLGLDVRSNIPQFTKKLANFQKKQIPFAVAQALTRTAQDAQKAQVANARRVFNNRKVWWRKGQPTGFKIKPATKRRLISSVYSNAHFLELQEEGGIKKPRSSSNLAIPTANVPKSLRKAGSIKKVKASGKAFFAPVKGGKRGLFRRVGGKRQRRSQLMFVFQPTARIKPRLNFKTIARRVGVKQFKRHFERSLQNAIRTAL